MSTRSSYFHSLAFNLTVIAITLVLIPAWIFAMIAGSQQLGDAVNDDQEPMQMIADHPPCDGADIIGIEQNGPLYDEGSCRSLEPEPEKASRVMPDDVATYPPPEPAVYSTPLGVHLTEVVLPSGTRCVVARASGSAVRGHANNALHCWLKHEQVMNDRPRSVR